MAMNQLNVTMFPDGRMDTENASRYTGLSKKSLAMMRCRGVGPRFIKRGRVWYMKDDIDKWLADGTAVSTAQSRQKNRKTIYKVQADADCLYTKQLV